MQVAYIRISYFACRLHTYVFQQKPVDYGANYSVLIRLKRDLVIKVLSHLPFMLETSGKPSP